MRQQNQRCKLPSSVTRVYLAQFLRYDHRTTTDKRTNVSKGKGRGKGLDTCYSTAYMSQTRDQQRFTISEVAADQHEPMVPQCIMWSSIAHANRQLDRRCSQQTHHCSNQPHQDFTLQPQLLISRPAGGRGLSWTENTLGQQLVQGRLPLQASRNLI